MNDAWCTCEQCDNEYKIISASQDKPLWCPFCGSEIDSLQEDEIYDLEQDEEWVLRMFGYGKGNLSTLVI